MTVHPAPRLSGMRWFRKRVLSHEQRAKNAAKDMAKKLINDIGYDRRYIMCEEKMISFPSDCKSENLKAVTEYVSDFRF